MIQHTSNRAGPTYLVGCDGCKRAGFDADTASFNRVREHMRARGWQTFPEMATIAERTAAGLKPNWLHYCPGCARDNAPEIRIARNRLAQANADAALPPQPCAPRPSGRDAAAGPDL
jgi:hypothetical protein